MGNNNNDGKVNRRREQMADDSDYSRNSGDKSSKQKVVPRSEQVSDEEDDSIWESLPASLSVLLIPSLKEVIQLYNYILIFFTCIYEKNELE
jgi:serine/threonine-protein kinase 24/25/MST4